MAAKRGKARKKSRPKSRQPIQAKPGGDNATGVKRRGVPQEHGGTIVPGAGRGPKKGAPNAGRPPDEIRRICRTAFAERIAKLEAIADGKVMTVEKIQAEGKPAELRTVYPTVEQRMKAMDMLAKYGLGTTISPMDGDGSTIARFTLSVGGDEGYAE